MHHHYHHHQSPTQLLRFFLSYLLNVICHLWASPASTFGLLGWPFPPTCLSHSHWKGQRAKRSFAREGEQAILESSDDIQHFIQGAWGRQRKTERIPLWMVMTFYLYICKVLLCNVMFWKERLQLTHTSKLENLCLLYWEIIDVLVWFGYNCNVFVVASLLLLKAVPDSFYSYQIWVVAALTNHHREHSEL